MAKENIVKTKQLVIVNGKTAQLKLFFFPFKAIMAHQNHIRTIVWGLLVRMNGRG